MLPCQPYHVLFLLLAVPVILLLQGCEDGSMKYPTYKFYDFYIENQTSEGVKIVPVPDPEFWILSVDSFMILPGQKIVVGSKRVSSQSSSAADIYKPEDVIALFDVYVGELPQTEDFSTRSKWLFSLGNTNESGRYTLVIN